MFEPRVRLARAIPIMRIAYDSTEEAQALVIRLIRCPVRTTPVLEPTLALIIHLTGPSRSSKSQHGQLASLSPIMGHC